MIQLHKNVWLLTMAMALIMSVSSTVVFVGGLVGTKIAPTEKLATLPSACLIIGTAVAVIPVTWLMKKWGRKKSIYGILSLSILISLFAGYAVEQGNFVLFCSSVFLFGATVSCVMQFRFAAMESVHESDIAKAASSVLLGGIAAAFIGPEVALYSKDLFNTEFSGSFVLLSVMFSLAMLILIPFKNPVMSTTHVSMPERPLKAIAGQSIFWVAILGASIGYAVMSFIMTATPISMHVMDGHSLGDTKWVIQSHIVAMFAPSLITAWIIRQLGIARMMLSGLLAFVICIIIAFYSHGLVNYWLSLVCLGLGWNFLFIGGTTLLPQSYQPNERFKVQAFNDSLVFSSQALGALSAGYMVFAFGWEMLLLANIPLIIILALVIIRWRNLHGKKISVSGNF